MKVGELVDMPSIVFEFGSASLPCSRPLASSLSPIKISVFGVRLGGGGSGVDEEAVGRTVVSTFEGPAEPLEVVRALLALDSESDVALSSRGLLVPQLLAGETSSPEVDSVVAR